MFYEIFIYPYIELICGNGFFSLSLSFPLSRHGERGGCPQQTGHQVEEEPGSRCRKAKAQGYLSLTHTHSLSRALEERLLSTGRLSPRLD